MKKLLMAGAAALAFAGVAEAAPINGTAAISLVGVSSSDALIGINTTFTNTISAIVGSTTGDFSGVTGGTPLTTITPVTATTGTSFSFTSAFGDFTGTVQQVSASGPATSRVVDIFVVGFVPAAGFTPAGVLSGFDPSSASATFSFTQTGGPGSSVSGSFTLASPPAPPPPGVPAPAALALFGLALAGLGVAARARKA